MSKFKRAKITAGLVTKLQPGETVMDILEPGFGVRRQKGAPIFFVRKFARGARHFETLGEHGTAGLTVTSARDRAARLIAELREGLSPAERRARDRAMPTLAEFSKRWLAVHVASKCKPATASAYRRSLENHILPRIGRLRVDHVDNAHVSDVHHEMRALPYAANRALAVLSKLMTTAEREGLRPQNSNPVKGCERYREERRERFLDSDELAMLGAALSSPEARERHSSYALLAIAFLLLTGMRLREALHLRWEEVDLQRGILMLGDSKTGRKAVILGAHAQALLHSVDRHRGSPWVFPSIVDARKPMADVTKAWRTVRELAGLEGVRLHDLRHSYASVAAASGGSLPMIGKLLGHTQPATTARYAHLASDPLRELADKAGATIAGALKSIRIH